MVSATDSGLLTQTSASLALTRLMTPTALLFRHVLLLGELCCHLDRFKGGGLVAELTHILPPGHAGRSDLGHR